MKRKQYFLYCGKGRLDFLLHVPEEMCISTITYAELMYGVEKSMAIEKNRIALSLFLSPGMPIGPMDLLISGHARSEGLILVTNNTRELCRVEGLVVEDWTREQAESL